MNCIVKVSFSLFLLSSPYLSGWAVADERKPINVFQPPGKIINVGTHRLHLYCTRGEGPAVIMDAGLGGFTLDWYKVQHLLADNNIKACSYDRAGYGWSQRGPSPRTTDQIVDELHTMLEVAEIPPPYVMAGHSFGGYNVLYYAKLYPENMAGLVLVDSSHPRQDALLPAIPNDKAVVNMGNFKRVFTGETLPLYPQHIRNLVGAILSSVKTADAERKEYVNYPVSASQVERSGKLRDMPLTVITRGEQQWSDDPLGEAMYRAWMDMQKDLVHLNVSGKHIIAEGSGHLIPLEKPEIIVAAIQSMIAELTERETRSTVTLQSGEPPE